MSLAERVRRALVQGEATLKQVASRLDIPEADGAGRKQVWLALRDLFNRGELSYTGTPRKYELVKDPKPVKAEKQDLLWRAMCLKSQKGSSFTVADVGLLARAGYYYAKRYLHHAMRRGLVVRVGSRGNWGLYRVTPGQERAAAPHWNRRAEKRKRIAGKNPCAIEPEKPDPMQILGDMEAVLTAISGEAMLLKGFIRDMRAAVDAAGGGHGAESGDQ